MSAGAELLSMTRIATVVKGYPRLSETFIAQEIHGLEQRGIEQLIVSLRHPTDPVRHAVHDRIAADTLYLPEYLKDDPERVRHGRRNAGSLSGFSRALEVYHADLARDRSPGRQRRFGQACVLAAELPSDISHLHVHFLHTPASVARYAALMRQLSWSFSAHAKDIWTTPEWELSEKLGAAAWGATCTQVGFEHLRGLSPRPENLHLIYHGLDFAELPRPSARPRVGDRPMRILSVGRLVEKKGYGDLLLALAALSPERQWTFEHVGSGTLAQTLREKAEALEISSRVTWHGARDRSFVFERLAEADLFVLPVRIAASGDRDGLPNVLMEAQALGVPVLSTDVSGVPELVVHGRTGWLVPQRDPRALAEAVALLMDDPALRRRLGEAGEQRVRTRFAAAPGIDRMAALLDTSMRSREAA